jgi:hypothetical protein
MDSASGSYVVDWGPCRISGEWLGVCLDVEDILSWASLALG